MEKLTFPKQLRLRKTNDIDLIFQKGTYRGLGLIRIKYLPNDVGYSRFLVSISKRAGHSPFRNRLKRLIREALRLHQIKLKGSYDICLFVTHPPKTPVQYSYVERSILRAFREIK